MKHSKVLCVCVCLWVGGVDSCHYQSVELEQLIAKLPAVFAFQNIPLFADFSNLALTQSDSRLRQDPRVHTTGPVCARACSVQRAQACNICWKVQRDMLGRKKLIVAAPSF